MTVATTVVPAVVGALGGALAAVVAGLFNRTRTREETGKLRAETEKLRAEAEEIRGRVANAEAKIDFAGSARDLLIYDSTRQGFSAFDFTLAESSRERGSVSLATTAEPDDTLVLTRSEADGQVYVWMTSYWYEGGANAIPPTATGAERKLRLRCRVRSASGTRTFVVLLKELGAPMGQYRELRRHRLESTAWTTVDEHFRGAFTQPVQVRFIDRSASVAPSSLEIKDLVLVERDPPGSLDEGP